MGKKKKFKKKHWHIIKKYCDGWIGELHHYVCGQREEALCLVKLMSVKEHGVGFNHAKNWNNSFLVPRKIKLQCVRFWKDLMSKEDYQFFVSEKMAWV